MQPQQPTETSRTGGSPGFPADRLALVWQFGRMNCYDRADEAMAVLLNEAGATTAETAAFIVVNGLRR